MDNLFESLPPRLLLLTLFLALFVLFTLFYLIRRHGFLVNANCWFCNNWTKVLYKNRNSFECPTCLQYNGFNKDGGYNKTIDAQYYSVPSDKFRITQKNAENFSNGLCSYCNNNQQLKVRQLANFTPLNNLNYDVEIEHFQKLLEKSYKLCKRCDKVLKTKIVMQNAWIFGNKIKYSRNSVLNRNQSSSYVTKEIKHSLGLRFTTCMLILFSLILVSLTLELNTDHMHIIQKYIPTSIHLDQILPYSSLFYDFYHLLRNAMTNIIDNGIKCYELFPNNGKMKINSVVPVSIARFLLEIMFLIWDSLILVITSLYPFNKSHYIYVLQIVCALAVFFSLVAIVKFNNNKWLPVKKKCVFKKLKSKMEYRNSSEMDEDSSDDDYDFQVLSKKLNSNRFLADNEAGDYHSDHPSSANLNDSFETARSTKTTYVSNSSLKNDSCSNCALQRSLDRLHISNLNLKPQRYIPDMGLINNSTNCPILSPPKLFKNVTQNSWTAGGFWKNDVTAFPSASDFTNLSRSSSQSSGYLSNNEPVISNDFGSLPNSREPSLCGDLDRWSLSEAAYLEPMDSNYFNSSNTRNYFMPNASQGSRLTLSPNSSQLYYKAENNKFYPIRNQNNLLFIQGDSHNNNAFNSLSSNGFNSTNGFITPTLFDKRPIISSLFKNVPGVSTQYRFSTPNCLL